jgi:hypothetical protein
MENSNFRECDIQNQRKLYILVKNMNFFYKSFFFEVIYSNSMHVHLNYLIIVIIRKLANGCKKIS